MKKTLISLAFSTFLVISLINCSSKKVADPTPAVSTGSASASINGTAWKSASAGALTSGTATAKLLTISMQLTEKDNSEFIAIGLTSYTGLASYAYGGTSNKTLFNLKYKGQNYSALSVSGTAGSGTIKITEYVESNGILNPGKVVGEFSGTVKNISSNEILTITNGKFTAIKVL